MHFEGLKLHVQNVLMLLNCTCMVSYFVGSIYLPQQAELMQRDNSAASFKITKIPLLLLDEIYHNNTQLAQRDNSAAISIRI